MYVLEKNIVYTGFPKAPSGCLSKDSGIHWGPWNISPVGKGKLLHVSWNNVLLGSRKIVKLLSNAVLCLVTQSCPSLCDPMDCSPPGSSVHGDSPGKNTGTGLHALLPGIFQTQVSNPGFLHCRWIFFFFFLTI